MRYAIPVTNGKLSPHFGHCEHFAIIDVDEATKRVVSKRLVASPGHQPGFLPTWLAGEGVSAVIAGGMGSRAQMLFEQNQIAVILGASGEEPEQIVLSHVQGTLETGPNVCDH